MIYIDVKDSDIGRQYRVLNVNVGDTNVYFGNVLTEDLKDILNGLSFSVYTNLMELEYDK